MEKFENLKQIVEKNWYINDILRRIVFRKFNRELSAFENEISKIDSIKDIDAFSKEMKKIPKTILGSGYTHKRSYSENTIYGYASELMQYAGLENENMLYMPLLEHGVTYRTQLSQERYNFSSPYIFQGAFHKEEWVKHSKQKCYSIGPYIHYARDIYEQSKINSIKKKNGKTLLFFPAHSIEIGLDFEYRQKESYADSIWSDYIKDFDTAMACVYCLDFLNGVEEAIHNGPIKVVSAGFKTDPLFVRRLKTIINMADTVLYSCISSSIGYAFYLGKTVVASVPENMMKGEDVISEANRELMRLFSLDNKASDEERQIWVNDYWGLDQIKTKQEIADIYYENKKRLTSHFGFK